MEKQIILCMFILMFDLQGLEYLRLQITTDFWNNFIVISMYERFCFVVLYLY